MTNSQRIIVNTAAQYTRTIINVCLSLYSTRLILAALGQSDYGIYSVVAGVVAMLSFITNALVVTTQRFLSFNHGKGDKDKIYQIFGNSVLLHLLIGAILVVILASLTHPVTHHFLNIDTARLNAASIVYMATILMLLLTFITAPFRALFIARENIVYISVVDILDGVFKVLAAILLASISSYDRLILYAALMTGISVFNLLAFSIYAFTHYEECHLPKLNEWNKEYIHELSGFAGWTVYSTGCIIARTQGLSVILNRTFGTMVNAAYGIALNVTSAVHFLAQSVTNAINPQIVKAEGRGDHQKMVSLSESVSKYATLLISMVAIPVIAEMDAILSWWLTEVPENAVMFCRFVIAASIVDQLTIGLGCANQAIGKIRTYSIVINTIKVLTLPAAWGCLKVGLPVVSTMWCYIGFEFICAMARLPFLKVTAGISMRIFILHVFMRILCPIIVLVLCSVLITIYIEVPYRFILTICCSGICGLITSWFTALNQDEQRYIKVFINEKIKFKL